MLNTNNTEKLFDQISPEEKRAVIACVEALHSESEETTLTANQISMATKFFKKLVDETGIYTDSPPSFSDN